MGANMKIGCDCTYCGGDVSVCHRCIKQVQTHVIRMVAETERYIAEPDAVDVTGIISNHMRAMWGLHDALNEYFAN